MNITLLIVPPKYNIAFRISKCGSLLLHALEPWCDAIYTDADYMQYITLEQPKTHYDLRKRCFSLDIESTEHIVVEFDASEMSQQSYNMIQNLSQIIEQSGEIGSFELDIFKITIKSLKSKELIHPVI